jgi:hypothetical protein
MHYQLPRTVSGGIVLSYKCNAECKHCMYACSPKWKGDWMKEKDLYHLLYQLSPWIAPSMQGGEYIGINAGIHFTGGEPFLNFDLLSEGVRMSKELNIPSVFAETNSYWAVSEEETREKLGTLKNHGLDGILISVNPFFLEHVPFERTKRAAAIAREFFGKNAIVYQPEFFYQFLEMNIKGNLSFGEYLAKVSSDGLTSQVEFFNTGRAPYQIEKYGLYQRHPASVVASDTCMPPFIRSWHNHFDNYGNLQPGYCGGISLGSWKELDCLTEEGIDLDNKPILKYLIEDDFEGLLEYARERGYQERKKGYLSKCHLCMDIRKYLVKQDDYEELQPKQFYDFLEVG